MEKQPVFGKVPRAEIEQLQSEVNELTEKREAMMAFSVSDKGAAGYDRKPLDEIDRLLAVKQKRMKEIVDGTPNQK